MHPQFDELTAWVARFVGEPDFTFEVLEPEREVSVEFSHVATLARPRRGLIPQIRKVPGLMAPAPLDPTLRRRAEGMGFSMSAPEAQQPKYGVITDSSSKRNSWMRPKGLIGVWPLFRTFTRLETLGYGLRIWVMTTGRCRCRNQASGHRQANHALQRTGRRNGPRDSNAARRPAGR